MRFNLIYCIWIYTSISIINAQSVLNYFNAQVLNAQVVLNWEVRFGNTCDGIEIQHSTDSISFVEIGEIAGVCGSKIENIAYQFIHPFPQKNRLNYYRLGLGGFGYSELETVEVLDFKNGYILRPNPIQEKVQISFEKDLGKFRLQIINLQGRRVLDTQEQGASIHVNTFDWPPGIYLFAIQSNKIQIFNGRIIKL